MGMNAPGEIARLTEIAAPEVGLVTNVGSAHIGMLGSIKAIASAKTELFRGLEPSATAVVNLDDPLLAPWARKLPCRVVTYGFSEKAQVRGRDLKALGTRQAFTLDLPLGDPIRVRLAVPGGHNVINALGAAAAAFALGQGGEAIRDGLEAFAPVKGRLNLSVRPGGPWVLDDTYNANPASLAAGLSALKDIAGGRRMALVLGDMWELGKHAAKLHREGGALAAEMGCALVLALGQHAPQVVKGARAAGLAAEAALDFAERAELIAAARSLLRENDVALVKGSRAMGMERVVDALMTGEAA
jgi:UDP-N-acetylmuramoyl-tripeptide--D-alanyl-D-alanine ligase